MKKTICVCAAVFIALLVAVLTTAAITAGNTKWEYRTSQGALQDANKLGQEGWELVAVHADSFNGTSTGATYYFKRKLP